MSGWRYLWLPIFLAFCTGEAVLKNSMESFLNLEKHLIKDDDGYWRVSPELLNYLNPELFKLIYQYGLGKRETELIEASKRPKDFYSFGLGKRSSVMGPESEDLEEEEGFYQDKRAPAYGFGLGKKAYEFGLGKKSPAYQFGLGKRAPAYQFGLGKRIPAYEFGLGKRLPAYGFGLGKRIPAYGFDLGKRLAAYEFGLGKRALSYQFGLGKKSQDSFQLSEQETNLLNSLKPKLPDDSVFPAMEEKQQYPSKKGEDKE